MQHDGWNLNNNCWKQIHQLVCIIVYIERCPNLNEMREGIHCNRFGKCEHRNGTRCLNSP